jgi:hypothetical protein
MSDEQSPIGDQSAPTHEQIMGALTSFRSRHWVADTDGDPLGLYDLLPPGSKPDQIIEELATHLWDELPGQEQSRLDKEPAGYEAAVRAVRDTLRAQGHLEAEALTRALIANRSLSIPAVNADLLKALEQCYAHLGWAPAKVPAYVADDARAAIERAGGKVE